MRLRYHFTPMRAVIQRVRWASVEADGEVCGTMGTGLFVLVGLKAGDGVEDLDYLVKKVVHLRVFEDHERKMNRSVVEVGGSLAVVSEFTLYGDVRRGHRPSWSEAMPVEEARRFWPEVERRFAETGIPCVFGRFQAMMACKLENDGPVTLILDSEDRLRSRAGRH